MRDRIARATAPRYVATSLLGYGGMAGVYLADDTLLRRRVAIKVLTPALITDPTLVARFEKEARTIAQLTHPNIVTIYDVDERDGLYYFVMEYLPGPTLAQVLAARRAKPLPAPTVLHCIAQVAGALTYAHQAGVVHRDVKPGNIMLDGEGSVQLTDFGIAKVADESSLTRTGFLVGTPAYMSPEQCGAGAVTGASDQYALGIVAYELLAGQPPFSGATMEVVHAHLSRPPPPLAHLRPDSPERIRAGIERMLAKRPEERYATAAAAAAAIGAQVLPAEHPDRAAFAGLSGAGAVSTTVKALPTGPGEESSPAVAPPEPAPAPTPINGRRRPSPIREMRWLPLVAAGVLIVALRGGPQPPVVGPDSLDLPVSDSPPRETPPQPGPPGRGGPGSDTTDGGEPPGHPPRYPDEPILGEIHIMGTLPPDAEITIRGGGTTQTVSGGTIPVPAGSYSLEATAPDHDTVRTERRVESGGQATWSPSLTRLHAPAPGPPVPTPADRAAVETEVRGVIDGFLRALESRDMDAVLRAFPSAAGEWAENWRSFYENVEDLQLRLCDVDILEAEAETARAAFHVDADFRDTLRGHERVFDFDASFRRMTSGWTLSSLSQNQGRSQRDCAN